MNYTVAHSMVVVSSHCKCRCLSLELVVSRCIHILPSMPHSICLHCCFCSLVVVSLGMPLATHSKPLVCQPSLQNTSYDIQRARFNNVASDRFAPSNSNIDYVTWKENL